MNVTNIPAPRVPFLDSNTGLIAREWYMFLLNIFTLLGSGGSDMIVQDLAVAPHFDVNDPAFTLESVASRIEALAADVQNLNLAPAAVPPTMGVAGGATFPITLTASPFIYTNTTGVPISVVISGGGVSNLRFSRNAAPFISTGSFYGFFPLGVGDLIEVTYTVAPIMTGVPT